MKDLIFITVFLSVLAIVNIAEGQLDKGAEEISEWDKPKVKPAKCPKEFDNAVRGTLPHESDCSKYYVCADGSKILKQCPENQRYNPKTGLCNWSTEECITYPTTPLPETTTGEESTVYWTTTAEPTTTTTTTEPTTTTTTTTTTYKPTTTSTYKPTTTSTYKPTTAEPITTTYEPPTTEPTTTTTYKPPTTEPTTTYKPPTTAPTTTYKPPTTAPTTTTTYKPPTTAPTTTTTYKPPTTEPTTTTTYRPPTTAPTTTTTYKPTTTTHKPSTTTTYKPTTTSTAAPSTTPAAEKPVPATSCPPGISSKTILLAHECVCSKYYVCILGIQVAKDCPKNHYFNASSKKCEHSGSSGCGSEPATTPKPHPTTAKPPPTTAKPPPTTAKPPPTTARPPRECSNPGAHTAHEKYCNLFYKCTANGKKELQKCPKGLNFNPKTELCDWPWNAKCKNKPIAITTPKPTSTTLKPPKCPSYKTKLPHETDCSLYYICKDGVSKLEQCRRRLYFNPQKLRCDRRENVACPYGNEGPYPYPSNEDSYETDNQV